MAALSAASRAAPANTIVFDHVAYRACAVFYEPVLALAVEYDASVLGPERAGSGVLVQEGERGSHPRPDPALSLNPPIDPLGGCLAGVCVFGVVVFGGWLAAGGSWGVLLGSGLTVGEPHRVFRRLD